MASPSFSSLESIALEVAGMPDGSVWPKGAFFKRLLDALIRDRVRGGANVDEVPTAKGRFFNAQAGGTTALTPGAFDLSISVADGAARASFNGGTVNNLAPDNILQTLSVPAGTSYALVRATTDGQAVTGCTLVIQSDAPAAPAPVRNALPPQVDVLLHLIAYVAPTTPGGTGSYKTVRYFYPATSVLLRSVVVFQTDKDSPQPGASPYDAWYNWEVLGAVA